MGCLSLTLPSAKANGIHALPLKYAFDKHFNCYFFFANWPVPGSPLAYFALSASVFATSVSEYGKAV